MKTSSCDIEGLLIVQLKLYADERGFFVERFNKKFFAESGITCDFIQDNHSRSAPGVLRGLHYQNSPPQGKLVGVLRGKIWDVAVDIRPDSASFGKYFALELSAENGLLLWIPHGFAHGFCVLGNEPADVLYKVTAPYNPAGEGAICYDDPELAIQWPVKNPLISERDKRADNFAKYKNM